MSSNSQKQSNSWEEKVAKKRNECAAKIPSDWRVSEQFMARFKAPLSSNKNDLIRTKAIHEAGILSSRELSITEDYTISDLISALSNGGLTSTEVTLAYCKRAAVAHQLVSCLTEIMFAEAQERARYLDDLRAQGKSAGPLHGLPISIKDNFHYKGTDATIGMVSFLDDISAKNSPLVDILLGLGAVLYVKTNVPQTMMTSDSHNNVFGRTLNPWNTTLGPGGSSGGEGSLIALRGSPLGIGTDIGGSVRIPAHCCGTYGFRPSASRIPNGGMRVCTTPGIRFLLSCAGPLSLDLNGIEIFFRSIFNAQPARFDSTVLDIPWRDVPTKTSLRIGVVPESSMFPLHPPIRRVLAEAVRSLEAQGHKIIHLDENDTRVMEANEISWNIFSLDQKSKSLIEDAGEPIVPGIHEIAKRAEKLGQIIEHTLPDLTEFERLDKLALLNVRRAELREAYRELWQQHDLDICIAPPAQNTAVPHDLFGLAPYTTFLNCLDYPSCIVPFGEVGDQDAGETFNLKEDQVAPPYDYELLKGTPCSIQLFTTTMRDEECMQMAKQIDQCLKTGNSSKRVSNI
ncbi:Amidase [Penicillium angulare]|uniref:Amidase n=1 Tax=Penicillium angulare TaxID=116970 RepID=UPI00253FA7F1|nr:Amidase [Penicillium angulare]KAJ5280027.1 Amidase [Penicillium angulare]